MMIFFSDRIKIGKLYEQWCAENSVKDCPASFVAFLQTKGWLNEDKILQDLKTK